MAVVAGVGGSGNESGGGSSRCSPTIAFAAVGSIITETARGGSTAVGGSIVVGVSRSMATA